MTIESKIYDFLFDDNGNDFLSDDVIKVFAV